MHTLSNGVRVVALPMPHLRTASVSVFVGSGSVHERRALNGIGHVVEHMVFKGTRTRDARRINLDAEALGAEVNAHTDKDHTAFHLSGRAEHALRFVDLLADLVQHATFPEDELERERQVLLQEHLEIEDDPFTVAYRLFDGACHGLHPLARPVIGSRAHIEHVSRADLVAHVAQHYTGANVVVAAAGRVCADAVLRAAETAFGALATGTPHRVPPALWAGGVRTRRIAGSGQTHLVLGLPLPSLADDDPVGEVAAAVLGEGMSSPLLAELRERRGLVYHAHCSADLLSLSGELVVEASFAPDKLDDVLGTTVGLLLAQADAVDPVDLDRARHQVVVRRLLALERPARQLEEAALDLLALGRVRPAAERVARIEAVGAGEVRDAFGRMLAAAPALALAGTLSRGVGASARERLVGLPRAPG